MRGEISGESLENLSLQKCIGEGEVKVDDGALASSQLELVSVKVFVRSDR
jgi:hypothetical protein